MGYDLQGVHLPLFIAAEDQMVQSKLVEFAVKTDASLSRVPLAYNLPRLYSMTRDSTGNRMHGQDKHHQGKALPT